MSQPSHHLDQLAISASGFVFDQRTGATFSVNATGRALLESLRDGASLESLVSEVERSFEVGNTDLRRDILEYVRALQDVGLLPPQFELE